MASEVKRWSLSYEAMLAPTGGGFEGLVLEGEPVVLASDCDTAVDELVEALEEVQALIFARVDSADTWRKRVIRENNAMIEKYRSDA